MNQQEFIEDVKKRLGEYVSFYNKPNPELNSVLDFDSGVSEIHVIEAVDIIKTFHTR